MPRWLWILVAVALIGWLVSPPMHFSRARAPGVLAPEDPVQTNLDHATPFRDGNFTITPLADFSLTARVLSRADYRFDHAAALSPTDFAFGWGRMSDSSVLARLDISQSGRWYFYHWSTPEPPIPQREIIHSSANMHMIPANDVVRYELKQVRPGDVVHLEGELIEAHGSDGSVWRSSMSRDDTGDGACEVVYVRSLVVM
ncbi:MAG TPA: hypothetical protein VK753_03775 [Xanthomonadaceae bacterium]|jgi:hypothetical protein|nr:hypothetical protein [Xanthomonadaceae bacterium]